ncbi:Cysteine desulfurase [Phytophthora palmivora]|uniref:Cysteine desulfurase n=1 Tax=Phytophthora palmivora TaxID=4796 RepID=A0A2P4YPP5_9STRA|nr:Cysteine desulfurase [Phytophthora palmivora]
MELERQRVKNVRASFNRNKNIILLGRQPDDTDQLTIFSLLVRFGDRFLHHNFVCALLNDLFGVQTSGGHQCADPFGFRMLGFTRNDTIALVNAISAPNEVLKPGATRISFPYFIDDNEINYILDTVHFVADHGWKFLPQYEYDGITGVWCHVTRAKTPPSEKKSICEIETQVSSSTTVETIQELATHRLRNLDQAAKLADCSIQDAVDGDFPQSQKMSRSHEKLRWFVYPSEAVEAFRQLGEKPPLSNETIGPCQPQRYFDRAINNVWDGVRIMRSKMTAW